MNRVFSGIKPSGAFTLGNYLGALLHWVSFQDTSDAFYCVVDLHALTEEIDPAELRANTLDAALNMLAVGLDPERCSLFIQSHVPEHARLTWLLECTATVGELRRMTQFKDKGKGQESVRASLFTYPVLMAADILLYDTDYVPVGDDQRQHLELTREVATRFNHRYGETFVVPEAAIPGTAARVMDLQHPERKMSKTIDSPLGTIGLLDSEEEITRKVRRAVTDTDGAMRYDRAAKPGLANLLDLLAAATGRTPEEVAARLRALRRPQERRGRRAERPVAPGARAARRARGRPRLRGGRPPGRGRPGPRGGGGHVRARRRRHRPVARDLTG